MDRSRKLVIATRNPGKKVEFEALLAGVPVEVLSLADFPDVPDVVEDRDTLAGNAQKKAATVFAATGVPALADDTGLEVDALKGRPGVHSARYAGEDGNAEANRRRLLAELADVAGRTARFRTVLYYADESGERFFEGVCEGEILDRERGDGGFGYDPLFVPAGYTHTFAEMDRATKNAISHRGRALAAFLQFFRDHLQNRP